jgi:Ala-tRNA(Pro) deacylase
MQRYRSPAWQLRPGIFLCTMNHMGMKEKELLDFLRENRIPFERVEHPPVFTCEEADRYRMPLPAVHTKNLFLHDEGHAHYYLVVTCCGKRLDIRRLSDLLHVRKLHFCSAAELEALLGIGAGAVTALAVINDKAGKVELLIDVGVWKEDAFTCHPLVNTATLVLFREGLEKYFGLCGHVPHFIHLDEEDVRINGC